MAAETAELIMKMNGIATSIGDLTTQMMIHKVETAASFKRLEERVERMDKRINGSIADATAKAVQNEQRIREVAEGVEENRLEIAKHQVQTATQELWMEKSAKDQHRIAASTEESARASRKTMFDYISLVVKSIIAIGVPIALALLAELLKRMPAK